jgi:hypothetical protein
MMGYGEEKGTSPTILYLGPSEVGLVRSLALTELSGSLRSDPSDLLGTLPKS